MPHVLWCDTDEMIPRHYASSCVTAPALSYFMTDMLITSLTAHYPICVLVNSLFEMCNQAIQYDGVDQIRERIYKPSVHLQDLAKLEKAVK